MKCFTPSTRRRSLGLAAATTPAALQAQIVYSGAQNLTVSNGQTQQIDFTVTTLVEEKGGDEEVSRQGSLYFSVVNGGESKEEGGESKGGETNFQVSFDEGGIELLGTASHPDLLSFGDLIDSSDTFFDTTSAGEGTLIPGSWSVGTTGYLGFGAPAHPSAGSSVAYGWVQIRADSASSYTLIDWAHQNSLGTGITAGAVPEPETAGLALALVAFGVVTLRRCRGRRTKHHV